MAKIKEDPTFTVMLLDSNNTSKNNLSMLLKLKGFKVDSCSEGFQAFSLMEKSLFDVFLVTENIGDMGVAEAVLLARTSECAPYIVILKNSEETEENKTFDQLRATLVVEKTSNYLELINALNRLKNQHTGL